LEEVNLFIELFKRNALPQTALETDNTNIARWYTDTTFAVHQDMMSHTARAMTLGKAVVKTISTKQLQKLNRSRASWRR
jgi:uncharacterized iron-regulated protein